MKEKFFSGLDEEKIYPEDLWGNKYYTCRIHTCRNELFEHMCFRSYHKTVNKLVWIKHRAYGRK